jgi:hypothetical protein
MFKRLFDRRPGPRAARTSLTRTSLARVLAAVGLLLAIPACGALIGINSLSDGDGTDAGDGPEIGAGLDARPSPPGDGSAGEDGAAEAGDGGCGDTTQSADNCGRCGHSCLGGLCKASSCQPLVLATGQGTVAGVALQDAYVYFTSLSNNVVARVLKVGGGKVETLAKSPDVSLAKHLAVDGTHVYWGNADCCSGVVARCPLAGCGAAAAEVLASGEEPTGIALDTGFVYWSDHNAGEIRRKPLDGGAQQLVSPTAGALPATVTAGGGFAFWIEDFSGEVDRSNPADGGYLEIGKNGQSGRDLALDPTYVYWGAAIGPFELGKISRAPRDGSGPSQLLGPAQGEPMAVAVDTKKVYWTATLMATDGGTVGGVYSCDVAGCNPAPTVLAAAQDLPRGIAVDDTAIYWGSNGFVMKLVKP